MKKKMPTSNAITAYGLLNAIARIVLEEPKRLDMSVVCFRGNGLKKLHDTRLTYQQPSCGTVGCIAGWALTLIGKTGRNEILWAITDDARAVMGLSAEQENDLFMPRHLMGHSLQQTPSNARHTVAHIRRFQHKYRDQLKATPVSIAPELWAGR